MQRARPLLLLLLASAAPAMAAISMFTNGVRIFSAKYDNDACTTLASNDPVVLVTAASKDTSGIYSIATTANALIGSEGTGTAGLTAAITAQSTAHAVAASSITVSPTGGTGVALEYTSTASAISSITVTNAGAGYAVGNVLTIVNTALPGRSTDLVITLTADDIVGGHCECIDTTVYAPIATTANALIGSEGTGTAGLTAAITAKSTAHAVAASAITVSPTGGTGVALEYTSTASAITSITVTNAGAGYYVGNELTIDNTALPGRSTDLVITLKADDLGAATPSAICTLYAVTILDTNTDSNNRVPLLRKYYYDSLCQSPTSGASPPITLNQLDVCGNSDGTWISAKNIKTATDALLGSEATGTLTATITAQSSALAVAANKITWTIGSGPSTVAGTGVALEYTSSTSAISSITVTNAGAGYYLGNILTIDNTALPGRSTDLVITLKADDLEMSTADGLGTTVLTPSGTAASGDGAYIKYSKTLPATVGWAVVDCALRQSGARSNIMTAPDALLGSEATGALTATIDAQSTPFAVAASSITVSPTGGTGVALEYLSNAGGTAITSITVTNAGAGYAVNDVLTIVNTALPGRSTDLVITLQAGDLENLNDACARSTTTASPSTSPTTAPTDASIGTPSASPSAAPATGNGAACSAISTFSMVVAALCFCLA